jgi:hypothetical protein
MNSEAIAYLVLVIIVLSIMIFVYVVGKRTQNEQNAKEMLRKTSQNIYFETKLIHIGGHPYLQSNNRILFQIRNNKSIYFYKENYDTGEEISISQIIKYELKTEEQIQKDITFSRFLILGLASIALPKKTKIYNEYLYLSYSQNNTVIDCLFKNHENEHTIGDIISKLNRIKIESNKNKECAL